MHPSLRSTAKRLSDVTAAVFGLIFLAPMLIVIALAGDRVCAMTRFERSVLPTFGLPLSLPRQPALGDLTYTARR